MRSRGGSFSVLSCLRSEDVLSVSSLLLCLSCFLHMQLCGEICDSSIVTLRTLSLFYSWADLSICKVFDSTCTHFDGMCLAGLSCSASCITHITVTLSTVRNVIKIWMENQFDKNIWLISVILNSKPYLLQCSWKLLKPLTEIDTCWCNNRQRNGCLFTQRLSFKIIYEGTKCCFIDLHCTWKQSQRAKFVLGQMYRLCQT
jgi:hypothetical protein